MDVFATIAKLWPSGDTIDLGTDYNSVTVPASFNRHAKNFETSVDGKTKYQFLFWNTGRHITSKRNVLWNFSVGGWGAWTATRWYGTPPINGPTPARVRADAFTIGGDAPLSSVTPIDDVKSSFAAGAWPFNGDDHAIGTGGGAVNVVAKDPFNDYQFAGWLQFIWGGDDSDVFIETDAGSPPKSIDFFDHVTAGPFSVAKGGAADLLATYGNSTGRVRNWGQLLKEIEQLGGLIPQRGDPGPADRLRLAILEQLLNATQPGASVSTDFEGLIKAAPNMSREQLQRALQSVKTTLDLGKTAVAALDSQLKKK